MFRQKIEQNCPILTAHNKDDVPYACSAIYAPYPVRRRYRPGHRTGPRLRPHARYSAPFRQAARSLLSVL
ncbi:hypothetical protein [Desulfoscipio gibsoniae]|uniref:hypothetical protein n=1 Tax=Desulfoscipio gibsoniae TaxID=102134 RepID=UPI0012FF470B|nr:hypothetical protein [Desulfoscipio gibsoniae]